MKNTEEIQASPELLENSISVTTEGFALPEDMSEEQQQVIRRRYCALIRRSASRIERNLFVAHTAIVLCHKYFASNSMAKNDPLVVSIAALYLACKAEDQPKSWKDVREAVCQAAFCHHKMALDITADLAVSMRMKERIMMAERVMLYTVGFELEIEQPVETAYKILDATGLYQRALTVGTDGALELAIEVDEDFPHILRRCVRNVFTVCEQCPTVTRRSAKAVAAACIYVALLMLGCDISNVDGQSWWREYATPESLQELTEAILAEYTAYKLSATPKTDPIGEDVEEHGMETCYSPAELLATPSETLADPSEIQA